MADAIIRVEQESRTLARYEISLVPFILLHLGESIPPIEKPETSQASKAALAEAQPAGLEAMRNAFIDRAQLTTSNRLEFLKHQGEAHQGGLEAMRQALNNIASDPRIAEELRRGIAVIQSVLSEHSPLRIFIETAIVGPALTTFVKEVVKLWARRLGESKKKSRSSSMDLMAKKSNGTTINDGVSLDAQLAINQ